MSSAEDSQQAGASGLNRRSFLRSSGGVASGVAMTVAPASAAALAGPSAASAKPGEQVHPADAMPREPVMAYVHNARRGEVTVMYGTEERTYRDPLLARRLLAAARAYNI